MLVHLDHVKYTATLMPFGLWEWVVMLMGLRNSPATHQRRVTLALSDLIGRICHVYLDDIIIWSSLLVEHKTNVTLVLEALRVATLYCSTKKLALFTTEVHFLGHHISGEGIEANGSKVEHIMNWQAPKSKIHQHILTCTSRTHNYPYTSNKERVQQRIPGMERHTPMGF